VESRWPKIGEKNASDGEFECLGGVDGVELLGESISGGIKSTERFVPLGKGREIGHERGELARGESRGSVDNRLCVMCG
jgi:hypothetical protein